MKTKYNRGLALDYLKQGYRVFETDSPNNDILVVNSGITSYKRKKAHKNDKVIVARLENTTYSLPFTQPHPLLDIKVKIIEEIYP